MKFKVVKKEHIDRETDKNGQEDIYKAVLQNEEETKEKITITSLEQILWGVGDILEIKRTEKQLKVGA